MGAEGTGADHKKAFAAAIEDGFGYAYRYRDPKSRMFEVTNDYREAEEKAGKDYEMVLVHFSGGQIDRVVAQQANGEWGKDGDECASKSAMRDEPVANSTALSAEDLHRAFKSASPESRCPCGSGRRYKRCCGISHPEQPRDGMGIAYRYEDPETRARTWTPEWMHACLVAGNGYEAVWVLYKNGKVARPATQEEYQEELEVLIGERISAALPEWKLDEFDAIRDQGEATRWLEKNRPGYQAIVQMARSEMERAIVLDGDGRSSSDP